MARSIGRTHGHMILTRGDSYTTPLFCGTLERAVRRRVGELRLTR